VAKRWPGILADEAVYREVLPARGGRDRMAAVWA
jgi:hypothetical protein